MGNARGLTLVDVAALLVAVAVGMCVLLPTVAQARGPDGQKTRSTANLRLHGQVLGLYSNSHRGEVLNPFRKYSGYGSNWDVSPEWFSGGDFVMKWDAYSYHWGPLIRHYYEDYEQIEVFAAPGDEETRQAIEDASQWGNSWVSDISYWYSPAMYFSADRFWEETGGDTATGAILQKLERHDVADMTFPSRKVVLLEKQDFTTPDKLLFAHPEARVGLLLGDGSVVDSNNPALYDAIDAEASLAPSGGNWADEEGLDLYHMNNASSPAELLEDQQHLYPAFYMWTREGIRGRDLL